ncbi:MAG: nucleotidyltransferase domain-containing protein [Chloracidobacterium sp.]|nr:nucleotidyltransferase domain-containing protein [Chloracidobacterium sp.]
MNARIVLAKGEVNDLSRQDELKTKAREIAAEISKLNGVIGILLSGSVARGPVGPSSDIDLHVVISDSFADDISEWSFRTDGSIENTHIIPESQLRKGWSLVNQDSDLGFWFYETKLGDELNGYDPLFWDSSSIWRERLPLLLSYRSHPNIVKPLIQFYIAHSSQLLLRAQSALNDNAIMDAQQELRWAVQPTIIAALIQRGWIIRGSKKRIEIAKSFFPDSVIKGIVNVATDIIGLDSMTKEKAGKFCVARLAYRDLISLELNSLLSNLPRNKNNSERMSHAIKIHEQYNSRAFDYYQGLIQGDFVLGPINHIRTLSSFSRVPASFISFVFDEAKWPIDAFLSSSEFSNAIKHDWLQIAELTATKVECYNWIEKLFSILNNLSNDLGRNV